MKYVQVSISLASDLGMRDHTNTRQHADDTMLNFQPLLNAINAKLSSHKMRTNKPYLMQPPVIIMSGFWESWVGFDRDVDLA